MYICVCVPSINGNKKRVTNRSKENCRTAAGGAGRRQNHIEGEGDLNQPIYLKDVIPLLPCGPHHQARQAQNIFIVVVFGSRRGFRGRYTWSDSGRVPRVAHKRARQRYRHGHRHRVIHALLPQRPIWSHVRTPINPIRWKAKGSMPIFFPSSVRFSSLIFVAPAFFSHWPHRRTSWWKKY